MIAHMTLEHTDNRTHYPDNETPNVEYNLQSLLKNYDSNKLGEMMVNCFKMLSGLIDSKTAH